MLSGYTGFPRLITLEDAIDDVYGNVFDMALPALTTMDSWYDPFSYKKRPRRTNSKKYRVVVNVGKHYTPKDVHVTMEGHKLKVCGKAIEEVANGSNHHHFEREYEIPEDVDLSTLKSELTPYGEYLVTFDKKFIEPKKEFEDLSTPTEYHIKLNFEGFKPEELSVKVVEKDLVVEGQHKSEKKAEGDRGYSSVSGYMCRRMHLGSDVDVDKLRAILSPDGGIEVKAPRDMNKIKQTERKLQIESH